MSTVDVALATDANYLPWCATAIRSILDCAAGEPHRIHLLTPDGVGDDDVGSLTAMVESAGGALRHIGYRESDLEAYPSKGDHQGGRVSWSRLLLPHVLSDVDRVVYLDADVLVRAPLRPLIDVDLSGAPVAAVSNVIARDMQAHVRSLGIDPLGGYFNAGVLVMDLAEWRRRSLTEACERHARANPDGRPWFDQDALNVVCRDDWHRLHPRWNAMNSLWSWGDLAAVTYPADQPDEARDAPAILHFEGGGFAKPWIHLSPHPHAETYRAVTRRTAWASDAVQDRTVGTRLIKRLPEGRRLRAYVALHRLRALRSRLLARLPGGQRAA